MPAQLATALERFDRVIVPSEFCADVIAESMYGRDVEDAKKGPVIIPHCFDPDFWKLTPRDRQGRTRFYTIGAWGERKNNLGVLKAYLSEFSKADTVELMMWIDRCDFDEVRSLIARSGLRPDELPALQIPDRAGLLTEDQLLVEHQVNDCFVTATRGEGWGLGLFEAAIVGRDIIAPLYGGQSDFLDDYAFCTAVPYQLTPCFGSASPHVTGHGVVVTMPPGMTCRQRWAEPDLGALADAMRRYHMHGRQPKVDELDVIDERTLLETRFGYDMVGPMFYRALEEIL